MYAVEKSLDFTPDDPRVPHCIEAEEALIGAILLDPQAIEITVEIFQGTNPFYFSPYALMYQAALEVTKAGKRVDMMTLAVCLRDSGNLEKAGGQAAIAQIFDRTISSVNTDQYALLVKEKWLRRCLMDVGRDISKLAVSTGDMNEVCAKAEERVLGITRQSAESVVEHAGDVALDLFNESEENFKNGVIPGLRVGLPDLDSVTQGFLPGDFVIAAGRPSMGKTALTCGFALNLALDMSTPVLFVSLETTKASLAARFASTDIYMRERREISSRAIAAGRLSQEEWQSYSAHVQRMGESKLYLAEQIGLGLTAQGIARAITEFERRYGHPPAMTIIDYIQLMEGGDTTEGMTKISRNLKLLGNDRGTVMVGLSQLSRAVEQRTDKRPTLADLRISGSIEQDADIVIMLYRDEYYNPETQDRGILELGIKKNRNGGTGMVKMLYHAATTSIFSLPPAEPQRYSGTNDWG